MKFTRFTKITARRVAAGLTVLAVSLIAGASRRRRKTSGSDSVMIITAETVGSTS